ncbi:uncharacterized lipoprotein syc1174_c-like isoform X4 [Mangifera indica]|uniref:uncharacterized lipoprotein syc1174_c-like isoform X4 n=1 Tax=Mangifera indica TaxID=29780 RepID=UPI001CFA8041|nr:uncharacterized lipoprotein syc1174_c-like isoform X4 [Mangifera indica]
MALHLSRPLSALLNLNAVSAKSPPSTKFKISCFASHQSNKCKREYTSVMIVPTGVGAAIGGYAGDALPVARALSSVVDCLITHPNVEKWVDPKTGQSTGRIRNPNSLLQAVQTLVDRAQVNAIAVVGRFPEDDVDDVDDYRQGMGIDVLAGVEAVISHLVVKEFQIPCAHAPALSPLPLTQFLSPKSAAEEIGYTFLPCVLAGLSNAPQYLAKSFESSGSSCILASDVDSVVLPIDACGGDGALAFATSKRKKPLIIAVEENETVLNDTPDKFGIEVVKVSNYWEAIGVIAAHKAGLDPHSLRKDRISNISCTSGMLTNGTAVSRATPITR